MKQTQKTNKNTQIVILITIIFYKKIWQQKITYNSLSTVMLIIIVIISSLLPTRSGELQVP